MSSTWNPEQYNRFKAERLQPGLDLIALVRRRPGMCAVDLGCGTGELTKRLHEQIGAASTLGIDSSETMLADSAALAGAGLRFERRDIAVFADEAAYDLVFSNAALHWLPDHAALFSRLTRALAAGGQLAVQMPYNFDHTSHTVAAAVAREEPFRAALDGWAIDRPVLAPDAYATLLHQLGYAEQHVRMQVYTHLLGSRDDVLEWVKGTLLTDYRRRLAAELFPRFLDRYRERLLPELDDTTPYFYPFKRILLWAQR
jgi:trans-aconitate 2-methyltransferase